MFLGLAERDCTLAIGVTVIGVRRHHFHHVRRHHIRAGRDHHPSRHDHRAGHHHHHDHHRTTI
ncbi:MAG TPA: hypothetical protein VFV63_18195 [Ilumatobacteraceae bacterium]|nr:hypothetical protein [Ilumatobacteraceae bacterium]